MENILEVVIIASIVSIITTNYLMARYLKKLNSSDKEFLIKVQSIVLKSLENWTKDKL